MANGRSDISETKMLPGAGTETGLERPTPTIPPARQLQDLPKDELEALAEEFGLEPKRYATRQHLVAALHERRQLIASLDRDALLDVVKWGRRPIPL
ncbi:MAG TPA: hypothetical protein VHP11_04040, partial [Tepidisphaeraceae bacterium]|nr:hypothetical protein [Tepidisphaeraceae bacterium]